MSNNGSSRHEVSTDTIDVAMPLRAEHAATLRVLVASLGADAGFSVDEIDDVKLAVSEVFTLLLEDAESVGARRAHIEITTTDSSIDLRLHRGLDSDDLELDALASTILSSVVDAHHIAETGITLSKRRHDAVD